VSGIRSTLVAGYYISVFAQVIDNFSFSFIAPLSAKNDLNWHNFIGFEILNLENSELNTY
jgi:uncharacterized membrane protein